MSNVTKTDHVFQRLPTKVTPVNYNLTIAPDLETFKFTGVEVIEVNVNETTNQVSLNVRMIELVNNQDKVCYAVQGEENPVDNIKYETEKELVTLTFKKPLEVGPAQLTLHFTGVLNDNMLGFYRSKYTGLDSVDHYLAVTQFESTYARNAFPCWDEPAHKATFDVTLVVTDKPKLAVLSNQPEISRKNTQDGKIAVSFRRTPIMSTYLVAFLIGELEFIEAKTKSGTIVRVYTQIGKVDLAKFSLETGVKSLDYYQEYFNIPYPLEKMDFVAVPDFASGAMENWGLVVYRETSLLVDTLNTSTLREQHIALTVCHELAHQWFGNLVTMEWWTDLWLNEGFASFMEFLCVDSIYPNFNIWSQFVADVYLSAMEMDSLNNTHPIEVTVGHPSEVDEIFDSISYMKGSAVIRMLYEFIGDDNFRKGMSSYLNKFSYRNASTSDLWVSLSEASGHPIDQMMTSWTKKKGYPLVTIKKVSQQGNKLELQLTQEYFSFTGVAPEDSHLKWVIPLSVISEASPDKPIYQQLMAEKSSVVQLEVPEGAWFKFNFNTVGLYRVLYPPEHLECLKNAIRNGSFSNNDRINLLDDLFALVWSGQLSSVELFKFMQFFTHEREYTVWMKLRHILIRFDELLASEAELQRKFHQFGRDIFNAYIFPEIGWVAKPDDSHSDKLLRSLIINHLVNFDDEPVLEKCRELFAEYLENKKLIPADLRLSAYKAVAYNGDEKTFEQFLKLFRSTDLHEEKNRIASSLCSFKDEKLLQRALDFCLSDEVRFQDSVIVMFSAVQNVPVGRDMTWEFFKRNKETFASRYPDGHLNSMLLKNIADSFVVEAKAEEVEQFFSSNNFTGVNRAVKQAIETIHLNVNIMDRDLKAIREYLNTLYPN